MFNATNPLTLKSQNTEPDLKTEEDLLLEQDIDTKRQKNRRQELKLNYDEDSSDEDYEKPQDDGKAEDEDGDDDMFGSDEETDDTKAKKQKKEEVKLLNIDQFHRNMEIEGDEEEELDDNAVNDEEKVDLSYYNDPENIEDSRKVPKVEPKMDAFNLREETSQGQFDEDLNYIRNADGSDNDEAKDSWYTEYSKKTEIERTRQAHELAEKRAKEMARTRDVRLTEELLTELIAHLEPVETPMERLAKLNKKKPKSKTRKQRLTSDVSAEEQERKAQVESITYLCSELISKGRTGIYDETREELMRAYKQETGEDFQKHRGAKRKHEDEPSVHENSQEEELFEFMYEGDDEIHGKYTKDQILEWKETYFEDNVLVKSSKNDKFIRIADFH